MLWVFILCIWSTLIYAQPRIIFDTDIGSDCDDAGAMAVLHKLADHGEITILGTIFSSNANPYGVGVCAAINTYYGRANIPLGQLKDMDNIGDPGDSYSKAIASATKVYGHAIINSSPDLMRTYKELLIGQADQSVTIVSVGHPVGLFYLINDPEGKRLVNEKVIKWIAMTQTDTIPKNDWNFGENGSAPYISDLLEQWPTEVYFSGAGEDIITGNNKLRATSDNNPVKNAYRLWGNNALENGRSSWDQIAVLFAARPEYFDIQSGALSQNESFKTEWKPNVSHYPAHFRVTPKIDKKKMEEIIEDLMAQLPSSE